MMARKKWNYLVNRYQDECASGGPRRWVMMTDMTRVMDRFAGLDTSKLKSRASPEFLWPDELTIKFIELRVAKQHDFAKLGIQNTYNAILHDLGLDHILTPHHLRKKWNYLVAKHKEISSSSSISIHTGNNNTSLEFPHQWPFYDRMTAAIASLPPSYPSSGTDGGSAAITATEGHPSASASTTKPDHLWTRNSVLQFIKLRAARSHDTKNLNALYTDILSELSLSETVRPHQARKKWNYLWNKYQELSQVGVSDFLRQSWPYYSAMKAAAATLPLTHHGGFQEEHPEDIRKTEEVVEDTRIVFKKPRIYTCFMCSASSRLLSDYYMFENDQRLLHTQKTVLELVSHLIGKKLHSVEQTTMLCTRCTMLVNEADSVINRQEKIKQEARSLYEMKLSRTHVASDDHKKIFDVILSATGDLESCSSPPAVEIEVDSISSCVEDEGLEDKCDVQSSIITYSKRGRKRKSTIFNDAIQKCVKVEPTEDGSVTSFECDIDFDDQYEDERPKRKVASGRGRGRGRGRRGRGKGRGRPTIRSTLIGRGLDGQYPTNNKRGATFFKGLKIYNCSECTEEFKKYTDLVTHRKEVHTVIDNTPLEVEETVLESGIITYFNKDKANSIDTCHPCKDCDKVFLRKDDLSYHYEISHTDGKGRAKAAFKDKSYACEECGDTFLFKYKLKLHINNKHLNDAGTSANDFTCGDCGSKLGSLPGLTFHMRKHHNKVLNYKKSTEYLCSDCGFLASSSKKLKEHQEAHCGFAAKEQVQCEVCGKTVLKVSLKMHKIKMHSEFKEQCDRCGERYATKTDLLRHFNVVHLKILLYSCKHCDEKFATSDALRYHRVKVHEKPSFFCHICNKSYKRVGELNTHVKRVHNDRRKAEVCTYCGKEYYDRSGLRNHLVSKHNVAQELTYSESYLRKKRVDGLPLAKHFEKRLGGSEDKHDVEIISAHQLEEMIQAGHAITTAHPHQHPEHQIHQQHVIAQHQQVELGNHGGIPQQPQQHHHLEVVHHQHPQQHHPHHHHPHHSHHHQQEHHQVMVDEAAVAARSLASYNTSHGSAVDGGHEDESLVVTEITEDSASEQQIVIDHMGNIIHHPNMRVTQGQRVVVQQQPTVAAGVHHHGIVQHHNHHGAPSHQHHSQGVVQQHLSAVAASSSAVPQHVHHPAGAVGRMGVIYQVNGHPHAANGLPPNHINM